MPPIEITYRLTSMSRSNGVATISMKSFYVPRVGEMVHLKTLVDGKRLEYIGIVRSVSYLQLPDGQSVTVILD